MLIASVATTVLAADGRMTLDECKWIWHPTPDLANVPAETRYFRKTFELAGTPAKARLAITADNEFSVSVNGQEIGAGSNFQKVYLFDVTGQVKQGKNVLAVKGVNGGGPAGVVAKLLITLGGDAHETAIVSDASWKSAASEKADWTKPDFDDADWS